jgi:hypothetical protein
MNLRTPLWIVPLTLAVALGLALTAPSLSGQIGEVSPAHVAPRSQAWPPRPERIVHLSSLEAPQSLSPQQMWAAYLVPADSHLVLTNVALLGSEMALFEASPAGSVHRRFGEAAPTLAASPADPGAPLGWVFGPGTQVALRNDGRQPLSLQYELVGYLVRD